MNTTTDTDILSALEAVAPTPSEQPKVKVLSITGIKKKAKAEAQTEYPTLPDLDGTYSEVAAAFKQAHADEQAAKQRKEMHGGTLKNAVRPFFFKVSRTMPEPSSCVEVESPVGPVLIQCKNAYKKIDDPETVAAVIGQELTARYFRQRLKVAIDFDAVPTDKQDALAEKLVALAEELDIGDALTQESVFAPTPDFHTARHRVLTEQQNIQLESAFGSAGFMTMAASPARGRK